METQVYKISDKLKELRITGIGYTTTTGAINKEEQLRVGLELISAVYDLLKDHEDLNDKLNDILDELEKKII